MHKSLMRKILAAMIIITFICSVLFMGVSYYMLQKSVISQMQSDGKTLIANLKREIINNNVSELNQLQGIFKDIKEGSDGNIVYVSLSDENSAVIVSDNSQPEKTEGGADAVSSATQTGDVSKVISNQETLGQILKLPTGEKVYNVSTDITNGAEITGALNIGISLQSMYGQIREAVIETVTISLLVMLLAIIFGVFLSRQIVKPIKNICENLKIFASGDFTIEFAHKGKDEIGVMSAALENMRQIFKTMVGEIKENANQVSNSSQSLAAVLEETSCTSEGITNASEQLNNGSARLAINTQKGMESLNALAEKINRLHNRAGSIQDSIKASQAASQAGTESLRELKNAADENDMVTNQIKEQVDSLSIKLESITEITNVIKKIAGQTNLLALNAMIESARAGENGRGFTVVADEIGKLSEQTTDSIAGIETIINEVGSAIEKTREYMKQGTEAAHKTAEVSRESGKAFDATSHSIAGVIHDIQEIINSIMQISSEKDEVVNTMEDISGYIQQSSASTEEISMSLEEQTSSMDNVNLSAQELQKIAYELEKLVGQFKL